MLFMQLDSPFTKSEGRPGAIVSDVGGRVARCASPDYWTHGRADVRSVSRSSLRSGTTEACRTGPEGSARGGEEERMSKSAGGVRVARS